MYVTFARKSADSRVNQYSFKINNNNHFVHQINSSAICCFHCNLFIVLYLNQRAHVVLKVLDDL